eukprot:1755279-Amphidinium_carterae.1
MSFNSKPISNTIEHVQRWTNKKHQSGKLVPSRSRVWEGEDTLDPWRDSFHGTPVIDLLGERLSQAVSEEDIWEIEMAGRGWKGPGKGFYHLHKCNDDMTPYLESEPRRLYPFFISSVESRTFCPWLANQPSGGKIRIGTA